MILLGLVAGAVAHTRGGAASARVYSVAEVRMHLTSQPAAWAGRTIQVRARAQGCAVWALTAGTSACLAQQLVLVDVGGEDAAEPLPLVQEPAAPVRAFLRRLPVVGPLVAAPQVLRWGADAVYRVQLRRAPDESCYHAPPCYEALLLDAASDAP
jgi:hypothetical protein